MVVIITSISVIIIINAGTSIATIICTSSGDTIIATSATTDRPRLVVVRVRVVATVPAPRRLARERAGSGYLLWPLHA